MLKIGEFSKLAMVTVKTLRFYDEEGLLKPRTADQWTGYRYYDTEQLYDLHKIVSLRQIGLSVSEIKRIISGDDAYEILQHRQAELKDRLNDAEQRFLRMTKFLENLEENKIMEFQAIIKEIPACTVMYSIQKLHVFFDLNRFIVGLGEECAKANPDLKCVVPEYCFVSYLDDEFTDTDFTAMYAQAVERAGKPTEHVKFQDMPAVTAVSIMVKGNYTDTLPQAYAFAANWVKAHGYQLDGKWRECYIDGVWNKDDPDDYLTEIQIPIRAK